MRYFGVPTCPYCKKRVNLIRTWRLKREGEYKCPRCGGISNIYLSPLVYVFSVLAICAGICIYFFHNNRCFHNISLSAAPAALNFLRFRINRCNSINNQLSEFL